MNKRAIFLDRDGVINAVALKEGKPYPPDSLETLTILPGVHEALLALKQAAYLLIVVTNQPDVARGLCSKINVDDINRYLLETLPLDDVYVCFHDDHDHCTCRKPGIGLFLKAQAHHDIDFSQSIMVGDRWRDVVAGKDAGLKTVWIDACYAEKQPEDYDHRAESLSDALPWILAQRSIA